MKVKDLLDVQEVLDMGKISNENLIDQELSRIESCIRTIKTQIYD